MRPQASLAIVVACLLGYAACDISFPSVYYIEGDSTSVGPVSIWVDNSNTNLPRMKIVYNMLDGSIINNLVIGDNLYTWATVNDSTSCKAQELNENDFTTLQNVLNFAKGNTNYFGSGLYNGRYFDVYATIMGTYQTLTYGVNLLMDGSRSGPQFFIVFLANRMNVGLDVNYFRDLSGSGISGNVWRIPNGCSF